MRRHLARGWCSAHYKQVIVAGRDPLPVAVVLPFQERLWGRVQKTDACWLWLGAVNDRGYGLIGEGGRLVYVHIAVWEMRNGPVPKGLEVCHTCDVTNCVRSEHLFLADHAGNMVDMARKGRSPWRKLTPEDVQKIRALKLEGRSHRALAIEFGVSVSSIKDIVARRNWAWLEAASVSLQA